MTFEVGELFYATLARPGLSLPLCHPSLASHNNPSYSPHLLTTPIFTFSHATSGDSLLDHLSMIERKLSAPLMITISEKLMVNCTEVDASPVYNEMEEGAVWGQRPDQVKGRGR